MKICKYMLLVILVFITSLTQAQKSYMKAMQSNLKSLYSAESLEQFDVSANKFLRIGDAEKDKWLPYYYASLAMVWKSLKIADVTEKDDNLNAAQESLNKGLMLDAQNSEMTALQGFIYMIKITVDPASRGQLLSPKAMAAFGQAIEIDPTNPRAQLFMGQMQHGMAKFFGSGTEKACEVIAASVLAFDTSKTKNEIAPAWGHGTAKEWLGRCSGENSGE